MNDITTLSTDQASGPDPLPPHSDAADLRPLSALDTVGGGNAEPTLNVDPARWEAYFFEVWSEDSL